MSTTPVVPRMREHALNEALWRLSVLLTPVAATYRIRGIT
jgi:hypothetical protein